MRDRNCVEFLQWCLPELGYRWPGYRKVRRTVCKRLRRRLRELALTDLVAYRAHLAATLMEKIGRCLPRPALTMNAAARSLRSCAR